MSKEIEKQIAKIYGECWFDAHSIFDLHKFTVTVAELFNGLINAEREECALIVEQEDFEAVYYEDSDRPTQVSHLDFPRT